MASTACLNIPDISIATLTDRTRIVAVEWPTGSYPPEYVRWSLWEDTLTLLTDAAPTAPEDVKVYWHAHHTLQPDGSTLPVRSRLILYQ